MPLDAERLKRVALKVGFDQAGIASLQMPYQGGHFLRQWVEAGMHADMDYMFRHLDLRMDPQRLLPGAQSALVVTLNYAQPNPVQPGQAKIARYALGRDYHRIFRKKLKRVIAELGLKDGYRICVDSAPVLERELAHQAGLGWFGKNTCLIDSKRGSWFLIGVLLLTENLSADAISVGGCGTCMRCINACPTEAIVPLGDRWAVDSRLCLSYHTIENRKDIPQNIAQNAQGWTFGCDICQEVCPFNERRENQPFRAKEHHHAEFRPKRPNPELVEISTWGEKEWDEFSLGRAVRRAKLTGFQRNARINLDHADKELF